MDDLKQAYEILGLPDGASKEEVEKRYFILVRRARASQQRGEAGAEGGGETFEEINRAYKLILGYEDRKTEEQFNANAYGKYKKMAGSAQKVDHFFSYYKFHVLGAIIIVLIAIFGIKGYIDHRHEQEELAKLPPAALNISLFGSYYSQSQTDPTNDTKPIEEKVASLFPEWKRITVHLTYVPAQMQSEQDMALLQKSMLDLITYKSDLYIMDKANFMKLAQQQGLVALDDTAPAKLGAEYDPAKAVKAMSGEEGQQQEHIYGIDLSDSPMMKSLPVVGSKEFIVGIRADAKNPDNAYHFIEKALTSK